MTEGRVVLLAQDRVSARIVHNALAAELGEVRVVLEEGVPARQLLRGRLRRLGAASTLGQALFMAGAEPLLRRRAARRIAEIKAAHGLDDRPLPGDAVRVPSVNSDEAREALARLAPAVVVVVGTRIIGRATLASVPAPFINMHAGITPAYRGAHGGYWALAEGRRELAGTTVHLVDEGIDTGAVLGQATFTPGPDDSFATYPYLHFAAGLPVLLSAVRDALDGRLAPRPPLAADVSRLRHHPTLWGYLARRLTRGVR